MKVQDVVIEAEEHATDLSAQASRLDSMLTDTRDLTDSAIKAANAYTNIVDAIKNAREAADDAVSASKNAILKVLKVNFF